MVILFCGEKYLRPRGCPLLVLDWGDWYFRGRLGLIINLGVWGLEGRLESLEKGRSADILSNSESRSW